MSERLNNQQVARLRLQLWADPDDWVAVIDELLALRALIPEVIEQLEAMRNDDAASIGISRMSSRFNAIIVKLREAGGQ